MSKLLVRELTPEEKATKWAILAALQHAGAAPAAIRAIAERRPDSFFGAAASLLDVDRVMPESSRLYALLFSGPEFLAPLVDPNRLSRDQAVNTCRTLMKLDAQLDIRLAHLAPGRAQGECNLDTASIIRLLDILNEISTGSRLVLVLNHLTCHPNPQIASKAALLMGRRIQNATWIESQILSSDARLRANLVEALWGNRLAWARRIVWGALGDGNNRVVGNAVLGLHFLQDPNFHDLAVRMLRDDRPAFRQTAAWVMGRSGDPGFLQLLRDALSDASPKVRHSATRALCAIRRPSAPPAEQETDSVAPPDARATGAPVISCPAEAAGVVRLTASRPEIRP